MKQGIKLLVYPAKDIQKAKTFYTTFLGVEPYVDSEYYVGYKAGDLEIGLDPNAKGSPVAYTDVADIHSSLKTMVAVGAEVVQEITEVGDGLMIAQLKDAGGQVVGLRQHT